jgi:hypothetical protein
VEVNLTAKFGGYFQVECAGSGFSYGDWGLVVLVFRMFAGTGGVVDTVPAEEYVVPYFGDTEYLSLWLDVGRYQLLLLNRNGTHALTTSITDTTVDSVA